MMLPPKKGMDIANTEGIAVAYCIKPNPWAPNARLFEKGFIKSAHFVENKPKGMYFL